MDLSKINLIIYDLDGTLYEDTHHFDYYTSELKKRLTPEIQDQFQKDYEAGKKDNLPLNWSSLRCESKDSFGPIEGKGEGSLPMGWYAPFRRGSKQDVSGRRKN